jgi:response regulator RpfG family c-di-GMP phosphodiesterase
MIVLSLCLRTNAICLRCHRVGRCFHTAIAKGIYLQELYNRSILASELSQLQSTILEERKSKKTKKTLQMDHEKPSAFAQFPREIVVHILFILVALFSTGNDLDRTQEYMDLVKEYNELDIRIMFGSALHNIGVNEVFDYIVTKFVEYEEKRAERMK